MILFDASTHTERNRPKFIKRGSVQTTWMAGTSARSKASSPAPAMTATGDL